VAGITQHGWAAGAAGRTGTNKIGPVQISQISSNFRMFMDSRLLVSEILTDDNLTVRHNSISHTHPSRTMYRLLLSHCKHFDTLPLVLAS